MGDLPDLDIPKTLAPEEQQLSLAQMPFGNQDDPKAQNSQLFLRNALANILCNDKKPTKPELQKMQAQGIAHVNFWLKLCIDKPGVSFDPALVALLDSSLLAKGSKSCVTKGPDGLIQAKCTMPGSVQTNEADDTFVTVGPRGSKKRRYNQKVARDQKIMMDVQ